MTDSAWQRFVRSFLSETGSDPTPLDLDAARSLVTNDRAKAEKQLLEKLGEDDGRAIIGLGEVGDFRAVSPLKAQLVDAAPERRRLIERSLWQILGSSSNTVLIIDVLQNDAFWGHRMRAAMTLAEHGTPDATVALVGALADDEPLVRFHAAVTLLRTRLKVLTERDLNHFASRLMGDDHAAAAAELREALTTR